MITALEILLAILIGGSIVFYLACALFSLQFFGSTQEMTHTPTPAVCVMVSVCGVDAGAWENWSSFCTQNYPDYEVLFGVTDSQDSAVPVLEKLVTTYPQQARLFKGLRQVTELNCLAIFGSRIQDKKMWASIPARVTLGEDDSLQSPASILYEGVLLWYGLLSALTADIRVGELGDRTHVSNLVHSLRSSSGIDFHSSLS